MSPLVWFGFLIPGNNMTQFPPKYHGPFMSPGGLHSSQGGRPLRLFRDSQVPLLRFLSHCKKSTSWLRIVTSRASWFPLYFLYQRSLRPLCVWVFRPRGSKSRPYTCALVPCGSGARVRTSPSVPMQVFLAVQSGQPSLSTPHPCPPHRK